jgi:hypothetical protein
LMQLPQSRDLEIAGKVSIAQALITQAETLSGCRPPMA